MDNGWAGGRDYGFGRRSVPGLASVSATARWSGVTSELLISRPDSQVSRSADRAGPIVAAMWRGVSKSGNEFYTLKIGKLKLLVFPNKE